MKAKEIFDYVLGLNDSCSPEERCYFGDPRAPIRGVAVCWYATVEVLEEASRRGCNVVICHEDPFHPMCYLRKDLADVLYWRANRRKLSALIQHDITLFRAHGTLDVSHIARCFMERCQLQGKAEVFGGFGYVQSIRPMAVGDLREHLKRCWNLDRMRYVGEAAFLVRRVAYAVGGMGLFFNKTWVQQAVDLEADAVIVGETDEITLRYAQATGIAWFETGHVLSETPGLQQFTTELREKFSDFPVLFIDCGAGWSVG